MDPIVSQLPSKTGMERSNRPKAKILQQNSLVVKMAIAAIVNEDPNQRAAALEQRAQACVQPAIQLFNMDLYDAVTAFKAARVMCPVTFGWLRSTRASVEAPKISPFLDNDATVDGLVRAPAAQAQDERK